MKRYLWIAVDYQGVSTERWNPDGSENTPHPDQTAEFHLLPLRPGLKPFSLFLKREQRLVFRKRRHADSDASGNTTEDAESVVYVVGYEEDVHFAHFASYAMLLPDGRVEFGSDFNHITVHERNLDAHPPRFYETWG